MSNLPLQPNFIPPMRNGVTASKVFIEKSTHSFSSLYEYLCQHFSHILPKEWQQRFDDGLIYDFHGQVLNRHSPYIANTHIYYYRFLAHEIHVPFYEKILFENDDILVVDKPHFLTMSPTGQYVQETLLVRLKNTTGIAELTPIHRLDRETAGVVLFSKRAETRGIYQQMFANRQIQKIYHAIASYDSSLKQNLTINLRMEKGQPFYTMQVVDGEANSHTELKIIEHDTNWALYELKPTTGKQHQLRVHMNHLGIPIKNDPFYPVISHKNEQDFTQPLQLLAKEIFFIDPITKQQNHFCSEQVLTL
ncbi:pseudouridine synthase [Acinetobacter gerneri]|jgi:tRNA pseudouridine32 synthase/23S rRNA pseudouridine746 synthase|uniref:pseudouridine synthase n=1 Tax=Acinetobacter gerneri TaxID=202952 RepID=UPI0023F17621|nr:pseudouridine synthase [Acinetobacter gerneri]MCH4245141.1 pseudouridine synthase [Acinetobacter gerneri]